MSGKKELRKNFSALRESTQSGGKDDIIRTKFLSLGRVGAADTVLLYASFRSEVDTWGIAENLLRREIQVAFPVCGENGKMTFHIVGELNQLSESTYGIREPSVSLPVPEITEKTVCVVPALAFTERGFRLGYGGGYYDRFLAVNQQLYTVGLAYELCIAENLPLDGHDVKVKSVITEERIIVCNE